MKKYLQQQLVAMSLGLGVTQLALAQTTPTGPDFTAITSAIAVGTVVAAITAIAALKIAPGFAKWAYNKVISWFR